MIEISTKATVLTAESKPYDIDGNSGVSHKVRLNVDGEIYSIRATEDIVKELKEHLGEEIEVTIAFTSRKENLKGEIVSYNI